MKELKDYLHLYLGCEVKFQSPFFNLERKFNSLGELIRIDKSGECLIRSNSNVTALYGWQNVKLILRPLSDMTEDEMIEVILHTAPEDMEDKPTAEDHSLEMFYNDGGNMVDADVAIGCNYSCICYEGQIAIRKCGSVHFFDDNGEPTNAINMPKVFLYLLSKHFDLFRLIESGLAIDKSTLKTENTNQQ